MELFHQIFPYTLLNLSVSIEFIFHLLSLFTIFKNEVNKYRSRYMHTMVNIKRKMQRIAYIYSLSELTIGHCVELTYFKGKLDRLLMVAF